MPERRVPGRARDSGHLLLGRRCSLRGRRSNLYRRVTLQPLFLEKPSLLSSSKGFQNDLVTRPDVEQTEAKDLVGVE